MSAPNIEIKIVQSQAVCFCLRKCADFALKYKEEEKYAKTHVSLATMEIKRKSGKKLHFEISVLIIVTVHFLNFFGVRIKHKAAKQAGARFNLCLTDLPLSP